MADSSGALTGSTVPPRGATVTDPLERARAKFVAASRDEYPETCARCAAPLRLHQERFSDPGRLIDPVGRSACLPPHRGRHRAEVRRDR